MPMPMIDVYAAAGTFGDPKAFAKKLARQHHAVLASTSLTVSSTCAIPVMVGRTCLLSARDGTDYEEGFLPGGDIVWQELIRRLVREILLACEEPYERAAFPSRVVTYGAPQHRIGGLQCFEDGALRHRALHVERDLVADLRERPQMMRKHDADHRRVWTSTESTGGRSRAIGPQVSPASADAYTWPPVVPKYTPHLSSASTAIASRRTFT